MASYGGGALQEDDDTRALLSAINAEEEHSYGSDSDGDLSDERARNIDRYLGRNIFPAPEGRSQVRDRSVYETVQWIMPSLSRIFTGDQVVDLPPVGPEDMEGAKQETEYLNHILLQKNNWFEIFDTGGKDALLTKAGYLYPYAENKRTVELEKYERQTPESLALIMQDSPEVISQKEYPDPDYKPQPQMVPGPDGQPMVGPDGQPLMMIPPPPMLYDIEIRRTKVEKKYCIEALPPERCKISEKTKNVQVAEGCPYFEFYDFPTISDLRQDGFEIDDDVGSIDADESLEDTARNQFSELSEDDGNHVDPSMRRVKCRWIWIRHDYDQDGIAELQYCVVVGNQILHREECSRIPIAVLCPDKLPHRHIGLCPADTVGELEEIKTAILRQGLDNLYLSQNPQKFADPRYVNLDDLGVSRPGGVFRLKAGAVFGQNFGVMPIPFVFDQAMQGLEYMDQIRENRVGVNRYFTGIDQNALNKTKGGMEMLSTMSAQRVEQIARHFANGIEILCSLLHEIILKSGHKKETVQLRGKWVEVDPATWRKRSDFRISVGYAAGNKDQLVQRLMLISSMQEKAMAGGLPIVTQENVYETAMEITKATDMQAPGRFWTDPNSDKAPQKGPPQPDVTVMAMEQIKAQTAIQTTQMDVQQKERDSQRDYDVKLRELTANTQLQLTTHREKLNHESQASQFGAQKDEHMARLSADLNPKNIEAQAKAQESSTASEVLRMLQQSNEQQTQVILAAFQEMTKALSAPRVIDRDKSGKAVGSRIAQ